MYKRQGLYRPIEGTVYIDEVPVNELRYNRVRRQDVYKRQSLPLLKNLIHHKYGTNRFVRPM